MVADSDSGGDTQAAIRYPIIDADQSGSGIAANSTAEGNDVSFNVPTDDALNDLPIDFASNEKLEGAV